MGIETFVEHRKEKQNFDSKRKTLNRKGDNISRKVLGALNDADEIKSGGLLNGKPALRTPFLKVRVRGSEDQKVAVKGLHNDTGETGFEMGTQLVVKVDGKKHAYAFLGHAQRIQYEDEGDVKLSQEDLLSRDQEVVEIVEAIAEAAQEKYGIEL